MASWAEDVDEQHRVFMNTVLAGISLGCSSTIITITRTAYLRANRASEEAVRSSQKQRCGKRAEMWEASRDAAASAVALCV